MMNDHYGLAGRPFQLTPDPRFWFESGTHKKAMAYLGYGLSMGEGFVVITGEVGAGKTTLVGHLLQTVDPVRVHAIAIASTQVEGDDMLRLVAQGLEIATNGQDKAALLAKVERAILDRASKGQKTLLIVDEAQNLPTSSLEELRMLSNVQSSGHAVLQTLLLGQPEFRDCLQSSDALEQLRQRVIATHHLGAMDAKETGDYVRHRMALVGWTGTPKFSDEALGLVHAHSGGIPRKINTLMTRVLLAGAMEEADPIDGDLVCSVIEDLSEDQVVSSEAPASEAKATINIGPDPVTLDLAARIAMLEAQGEEQGAALRRVLGLLVEWVEAEETRTMQGDARRAPAA